MNPSIPFHHLREATVESLEQGLTLLHAVDDQNYQSPAPAAFNASIGAHYRHIIEHFEPLVQTLGKGVIDYDARPRDHRLEIDRTHAIERTLVLIESFQALDSLALAEPVQTRCKISYRSPDSPLIPSTLGREAVYAIAHAVHHFALIGVIAHLLHISLPSSFGFAPSTVHHQQEALVNNG
ncbi:MAG: hypothetical protein ACFCU4_00965 [Puniceicoccaceae bacterium]